MGRLKADRSIELIDELSITFKAIGYEQTKNAIKNARNSTNLAEKQNQIEGFIFKECCRVFRISQNEIVRGKCHGTRTECLMIIFALIKKHLPYSNAKIGGNYGKSGTRVTRAITKYNCLNKSDKRSALIIERAHKINDAIIKFKEEIEQK